MKRIVIDASVTVDWLFDGGNPHGSVGKIVLSSELVAPSLWQLEVVNAVLIRERRKTISASVGNEMIDLLQTLNIRIVSQSPLLNLHNVATLARPH